MNKVKYFLKNIQFIARKSMPYYLVLLFISLFISISGLLFSLDNNTSLGNAQFIDINAGLLLPIMAILFSFSLAFNYHKYVKNYNLSSRYSNFGSFAIIVTFCILMAIIFGVSVYLTHIIAYIGRKQVVSIVYNIDFVIVLQGMVVVLLYSLLGSSIGYFVVKLTNISGFFSIIVGLFVVAIFYAYEYGGYARENDNFILKTINFIMVEDNLGILTAKVLSISTVMFGADHLITEIRGVR